MTQSLIPVLESKIPNFVREQYPRFASFLVDYYTWLEEDENYLRIIEDWNTNSEPSLENATFIDAFLLDLGWDIDRVFTVRKSLLLHALKDFYLSRGTAASFGFMWKLLYNEPVSIRYPREELFVPSISEYGERYFLFSTLNNQTTVAFQQILKLVSENGGSVKGLTSKSQADIESIQIVLGFGQSFLQIETLRPIFPFQVNETLEIKVAGYTVYQNLHPVLGINISNGGTGYRPGEQITVSGAVIAGQCEIGATDSGPVESVTIVSGGTGYSIGDLIKATTLGDGFGFSAVVTGVTAGVITSVKVTSGGYNYDQIPKLIAKGGTAPAVLTASGSKIGSIKAIKFNEPSLGFGGASFQIMTSEGSGAVLTSNSQQPSHITKNWENRKGFINENSRLLDSYKYQQFSYSIVSGVQSQSYDPIVGEYLHPVGFVKFGLYEITTESSITLSSEGSAQNSTVFIIIETDPPLVLVSDFDISTLDTLEIKYTAVDDILGITLPGRPIESFGLTFE